MLPKQYRLPMHDRLTPTVSLTSNLFSLKAKATDLTNSRFGFIIAKKVDSRASARNATKRMYRDCIQKHLGEIVSGYDMLFILRKSLARREAEMACSEVQRLLKRGNLSASKK